MHLDQPVGAGAADEEGCEQDPEHACLRGIAQRSERGRHDRRVIGAGAGRGCLPTSPNGRRPTSAGRSRISINTANAAMPSITHISANAVRHPIRSVRLASSGRNTNWPVATLAVRMPTTRPRRASNQRAATVALSTSAVMPVPMPTTTPHSRINCQTSPSHSDSHERGDDDQQCRQRDVAEAVAVHNAAANGAINPNKMKRIDNADEISAVLQPNSLLQRHDEYALGAPRAGADNRGQEGDPDHHRAVVDVAASVVAWRRASRNHGASEILAESLVCRI